MKFQPVFVSSHLKPGQQGVSKKMTYVISNMSGTNEKRVESEKSVVELMIRMYCQHKEHNHELCRMRWSGPRMLYYHPLTAIRHLWRESRERTVNSNEK